MRHSRRRSTNAHHLSLFLSALASSDAAPPAPGASSHRPSSLSRATDGCWFHLAPGSGVFINVSRTRIFETREALRAEWHLPHHGSTLSDNDGMICRHAMHHGYTSVQILGRSSAEFARGRFKLWQHAAAAAPFNGSAPKLESHHSLYRRRGWRGIPELVMCSGPCITEESTSPCPGLPLWREDGAPCECDHAYPLLSCRESQSRHQSAARDREDPCPSRRGQHGG